MDFSAKIQSDAGKEDDIKCRCGGKMDKMIVSNLYCGTGACCDKCGILIQGTSPIYHCPLGQNSLSHPHGYDICRNCANSENKILVCMNNNRIVSSFFHLQNEITQNIKMCSMGRNIKVLIGQKLKRETGTSSTASTCLWTV